MVTRYRVELTDAQRADLRTQIGSGVAPARELTHARILLKADHADAGPGWTDVAIAGALEVNLSTGRSWPPKLEEPVASPIRGDVDSDSRDQVVAGFIHAIAALTAEKPIRRTPFGMCQAMAVALSRVEYPSMI